MTLSTRIYSILLAALRRIGTERMKKRIRYGSAYGMGHRKNFWGAFK